MQFRTQEELQQRNWAVIYEIQKHTPKQMPKLQQAYFEEALKLFWEFSVPLIPISQACF